MEDSGKPQDFEARLRQARSGFEKMEEQAGNAPEQEPSESAIKSGRAGSELLASVFAGGLLGFLIDRFAHTTPLGLISLMVLGFISGVMRANATMKQANKKNAEKP